MTKEEREESWRTLATGRVEPFVQMITTGTTNQGWPTYNPNAGANKQAYLTSHPSVMVKYNELLNEVTPLKKKPLTMNQHKQKALAAQMKATKVAQKVSNMLNDTITLTTGEPVDILSDIPF